MIPLFNNDVLPHSSGFALERALAAFSLLSEPQLDYYWSTTDNLVSQHLMLETRQNLWWHCRRTNGSSYWICLDPAEFRRTLPDSPAIVRDLPAAPTDIRCRIVLQSALHFARSYPNGLGEKERFVEIAEARLQRHPDAPSVLPTDVASRIHRALRESSPDLFQKVVFELYENYLLSYRLEANFLNHVILLLQLQAAFGIVIDQDWLSKPEEYLASLIHRVLQEPALRLRAMSAAKDICNVEFKSGRAHLRAALESDLMSDATSELFHAYHLFRFVQKIATLFQAHGASLLGLSFTANLVEEAAVCTMTGITTGARFIIEPPLDRPTRVVLACQGAELQYADTQRASRRSASEIQPFFTRRFADIVGAHALAISANLNVVKAGVVELLRLGQEVPGSFERGWIELALLNAYRRLGQKDLAEAAAARIAAQLII